MAILIGILCLLIVSNSFADINSSVSDQEIRPSIGKRFLCQYGQHIQENMYNYTCIIEMNPETAFQCYSLVTILQPPFTINWIHVSVVILHYTIETLNQILSIKTNRKAIVLYPNDADFTIYPKVLLHTEIEFCGSVRKGIMFNSGSMLEFSNTGTIDECPMAGGTIKVEAKYGTLDEMPISKQCDTVSYTEATFYHQNIKQITSAQDSFN